MGRTTLIVDASSIKDTLVVIIKEGFEKAFEHFARVNDKAFEHFASVLNSAKKDDKAVEADISGLREQIMANVQVLLPVIGSKHGMSFTMGNRFAVVPDVHVITVGEEPKVKAYVLQGNVTCCDKFIDASAGVTAADALKKLLILTQQMLEFHIDEVGNYTTKYGTRDDTPVNNGWDSTTVTNPASTLNFGGHNTSGRSDNSDDSAVGGLGHGGHEFVTPVLSTDSSRPSTIYDLLSDGYSY